MPEIVLTALNDVKTLYPRLPGAALKAHAGMHLQPPMVSSPEGLMVMALRERSGVENYSY